MIVSEPYKCSNGGIYAVSPRPKGLLNKNVIQKELKSPKGVKINLKVIRNPEMFCLTDYEKKIVKVCMG